MAIRDEYGYASVSLNIGDWDMSVATGVDTVDISHNLSATEWKTIKDIEVIVRNDTDDQYNDLDSFWDTAAGLTNGGILFTNSTTIRLGRYDAGLFSASGWTTTAGYNRGWINFKYIAD